MVLNNEYKILIKKFYLFENYSARKLITEFPVKGWKLKTLKKLCESMNNGDFTAYLNVTFNGCCLQVFVFYVS